MDRFQITPSEVIENIFEVVDVAELLRFRRVNNYFHDFIRNAGFISRFNRRLHTSQVWLYGHCFTAEHAQFGVLYGLRVSDGLTMVRPILPLPEWGNFEAGVMEFLDAARSVCLLHYPPVDVLVVYNPWETMGNRHLVALPGDMLPPLPDDEDAMFLPLPADDLFLPLPAGDLLFDDLFPQDDGPRHFSIYSNVQGGYHIVYLRVVVTTPVYNVYSSLEGDWTYVELEYVGQRSLHERNLNATSISLVVGRALFTVYMPRGVLGDGLFYTIDDVRVPYPRTINSGNWTLDHESPNSPLPTPRLFRGASLTNPTQFVTNLNIPPEFTQLNELRRLNLRVVDGVVYVSVSRLGFVYIFRYHVVSRQWLAYFRYPYPPIEGQNHSRWEAFTNHLTLMALPPNND